jgi:hypothetical protein
MIFSGKEFTVATKLGIVDWLIAILLKEPETRDIVFEWYGGEGFSITNVV